MSKHTLGPWRVGEKRGDYIDIRHDNQQPGAISWVLAQVVARQSWSAEAEANARLIAAAPDLLEAMQNLIDEVIDIRGIEIEIYKPAAFEKARTAIKKATS